jgi:transcriptional regulator with GAF, ATPase, and Fis domain
MRQRSTSVTFATHRGGQVTLNFPGPLSAFKAYPLLEVLRSYDAESRGVAGRVPVHTLKDKVILVGVIAEGRGQNFHTPIDARYPSIGLHATFLDNALQSRFLYSLSWPWTLVLSALFGVGVLVSVLIIRSPKNVFVLFGWFGLLVVLSFALFVVAAVILPVVPILAVGLLAAAGGLLYRHQLVQEQYRAVSKEKDSILAQLRDREARLAILERELIEAPQTVPVSRTQELLEEIQRYKAEIRALSSQAGDMEEYPVQQVPTVLAEFEGIIYSRTGQMKSVVDFVKKIAASDAPVLIMGESGTGKELIARAIHKESPRAQGPFVAVNCGALAEGVLESELFGHERGAFTGAVKDKMGRFELADRGTIFLDEIGEVSESFQVKLLRVVQEGELERVGGSKTLRVNVRVLAATNKDLKEQVRLKNFREDLYYRLNVLSVGLPPLRERQEDIPLLVQHFLEKEGGGLRVSKSVMEALQKHTWPGNVRELESVIKRGILLARADKRTLLNAHDLSEEIAAVVHSAVPIEEQVLDMIREKGFLRSSVSETAASLGGLNRGTVAEYLRGECLRVFTEEQFDLERAIRHISLSNDSEILGRLRKRMVEYLSNIADGVDKNTPWEISKAGLRPKTKNLPQRYHTFLEQTAEAFYRGLWKLPG